MKLAALTGKNNKTIYLNPSLVLTVEAAGTVGSAVKMALAPASLRAAIGASGGVIQVEVKEAPATVADILNEALL